MITDAMDVNTTRFHRSYWSSIFSVFVEWNISKSRFGQSSPKALPVRCEDNEGGSIGIVVGGLRPFEIKLVQAKHQ